MSKKYDFVEIGKHIEEWVHKVPFGHSLFQIGNFILSKDGDHRDGRQALLELDKKYNALTLSMFNRDKYELEVMEKDRQIRVADRWSWLLGKEKISIKKRLLNIEREEKEFLRKREDKLIQDAFVELLAYYEYLKPIIEKMGRENFEMDEQRHWIKRIKKKAERELLGEGRITEGTLEIAEALGMDPHQLVAATQLTTKMLVDTHRTQLLEAAKDGQQKKEEVK